MLMAAKDSMCMICGKETSILYPATAGDDIDSWGDKVRDKIVIVERGVAKRQGNRIAYEKHVCKEVEDEMSE